MDGAPKILNGSHPFQGRFVIHRLGLATINLYTKYEVSMFRPTHYKDMKGGNNAKIRVVLGIRGHRRHNYSIEHKQLHIRL